MTVNLTPEMERFVGEQVRAGAYGSADEAVNEMLAHILAQQAMTAEDIAELRAEVAVGIAEADRGEFVEFTAEDIIAEGRAALARNTASAKNR